MRNKGFSFKEIAVKLDVAKSTAKLWTDDIELQPEQKKHLYTRQIEILSRGPQSSHERRKREVEKIIKDAEQEIKIPIDFEAYKLFGTALYWAEGNKTKQFAVCNSDPFLIKFMVNWMHDTLGIKASDITAHLNIHERQSDADIKKFWSELTGIPLINFGKTFIKPANTNFKKNTLYYGTIKLRAKKGTNFRYKVFGWTNVMLKNFQSEIEQIERRWDVLKTNYNRNLGS